MLVADSHRRSPLPLTCFVFVLLFSLAACQGQEESRGGTEGVIRLTYWSSQNPQERAVAKLLVEQWNRENPGIQVIVQPLPAGQSSEEVLLASIVAKTTPDVCSNVWPGIVTELVRANGLVALDQFANFDSLMSSRIPADLYDRFRSPDGHYHQIPWKSNPILLQYNAGLFRELGITAPPRTYSEFLDAAKKVYLDEDEDGHPERWIGNRKIHPIWHERRFDYYAFYLAASGGTTFDLDGKFVLNESVSDQVFSLFRELWKNEYYPMTELTGDPFDRGLIATKLVGPWNIARLRENATPGLEYAFSPIPVPDDYSGPAFTYGDFKNIAVFSTTRHPEEAWRFASYLVSKEADLLLLEYATQIPIRSDILTDAFFADYFAANPMVADFAGLVPNARGVGHLRAFPEIMDALAQQFEAASVFGVISPQEGTRKAVDRIRAIEDWNQ